MSIQQLLTLELALLGMTVPIGIALVTVIWKFSARFSKVEAETGDAREDIGDLKEAMEKDTHEIKEAMAKDTAEIKQMLRDKENADREFRSKVYDQFGKGFDEHGEIRERLGFLEGKANGKPKT